jgi:putative FmdB family regulatory protein
MPLYEFTCRKCQTDFELIVPASQRDSTPCPYCESKNTVRRISLAAPAKVASTVHCDTPIQSCQTYQETGACCGGHCSGMH